MPGLTRWYVKTALVCLASALLLGVFLAWPAPANVGAWQAALWPAWIHLLTVGWLTQLIFGVAFWLFPRHSRERPQGPLGLAIAAYPLLNAGIVLRLVAEPALVLDPRPVWRGLLAASALSQWAAGVLMAGYLWTRVRHR